MSDEFDPEEELSPDALDLVEDAFEEEDDIDLDDAAVDAEDEDEDEVDTFDDTEEESF